MRPIDVLRSRTAAAPHTYLDNLAITPQAVYSLRKMISTATVAIRARRSSDNAEQDFGFSGFAFDTAGLLAFAGAGSAYVVKFYDQVGTNHLLQATTASQPRIVNAGSFDNRLSPDGVNDFMKCASYPFGAAQCGIYMKANFDTPAGTGVILEAGAGGPGSVAQSLNFLCGAGSPNYITISSNGAGALRRNDFGVSATLVRTFTVLYDRSTTGTNEIQMWIAGSSQSPTASNTTDQTGVYSANDLYVGARSGTSLFYTAEIETMAIYNADTSALRTSIEAVVG